MLPTFFKISFRSSSWNVTLISLDRANKKKNFPVGGALIAGLDAVGMFRQS